MSYKIDNGALENKVVHFARNKPLRKIELRSMPQSTTNEFPRVDPSFMTPTTGSIIDGHFPLENLGLHHLSSSKE